jgi:hypothetical protein
LAIVTTRKKPLILVSRDYDPAVWKEVDSLETEFESWLAVAQDVWGFGCFGPGQDEVARLGANATTITKAKIIGAIGSAIGGLGPVAEQNSTYIEVFECDPEVLKYKQDPRSAQSGHKFLKLASMDPARIDLKQGRYHGLISVGAVGLSADPQPAILALAQSIRPGGYLFVDELCAADPAVARLISQGLSRAGETLHLHAPQVLSQGFANASLQLRAQVAANPALIASVRHGMEHGQAIAQILKNLPEPFRKQRMMAFADELKRCAVLFQALERGLVTAVRTTYSKPSARLS